MRFSIPLRIGIIRSTCAHVAVAKVFGAATWSPHTPHRPPWGGPALAWACEISRLG